MLSCEMSYVGIMGPLPFGVSVCGGFRVMELLKPSHSVGIMSVVCEHMRVI